jgi:hypothetical protein
MRFCFLVLGAFVVACSSSTSSTPEPMSGDADAGDSTVDTTQVEAYSEAEVQDLFNDRCVRCHDATSPNLNLTKPFTKYTVGVPTGGTSGATVCGHASKYELRIAPGDRDASLLWHKVQNTQDCGSRMPYEAGDKPLDATELERLGLYIDSLAPVEAK